MDEIYRIIAWKLINLRQEKELTQEQLGVKTGLSKYQIGRIERGHGDTTLMNLSILANFFEIEMKTLFQKPQHIEIEILPRQQSTEKIHNNIILKTYSKSFERSAKIKTIVLPPLSLKKIRVESNAKYDCVLLSGQITVKTNDDMARMKATQVVSLKGNGVLKLINSQSQNAEVLIFTY